MADAPLNALSYLGIDKPTLGYRTNTSPVDESPHWVFGSQNTMATIVGEMEKRPGFALAVETALSAIPGTIVRLYTWRRFSGSFFVMASVQTAIPGSLSQVWKYEVGDVTTQTFSFSISSPQLDWNYPSGPLPFGQTSTAYSTSVLSAWGGTAPFVYSIVSGALPPGLSINATMGVISGTPTTVGDYSFAVSITDATTRTITRVFSIFIGNSTVAVAPPSPNTATIGVSYTGAVTASGGTGPYTIIAVVGSLPPGMAVDASGNITGTPSVSGSYPVTFQATDSIGRSNRVSVTYLVSSVILNIATEPLPPSGKVGQAYTFTPFVSGGSSPFTVLSSTPAFFNPFFHYYNVLTVVFATAPGYTVGTTVMLSGSTAANANGIFTVNTIGSPTSIAFSYFNPNGTAGTGGTAIQSGSGSGYTVTATPAAITAQTGYIYGQTFTSIYGHESSMSALSTSTGIFTNLAVQTNVLSSADLQVNGINLYRTTDGGDADPAAMRLVASLPNIDATYTDSTLDIFLGSQTGPALYVNDPPQPLNGFVWSNGRIWGKNGALTWFTGNEEITNGIPAECMSDAINGNFYAWPSQVGGIAVTSNGVDIGIAEQFWQVSGDTLSTFRKSKLLQGGGVRFPINIISVGDNVLWIDTAKQGWSSADGEFGEPIRPDLASLTLSQAFVGFHKSKLFNWIYILDAVRSILYVYNLDLNIWNTPWQFGARMTAITSGELTEGNIELIAAFDNGHVMYLNPDEFVDDGTQYGETMKSNLLAIVPGRGSTARNAAEVRRVRQFDMEVSTIQQGQEFSPRSPEYFGCLVDDDPGQSSQDNFFDLSANITDPQYQDQTVQKRYIIPKRWMVDQAVPMGRRIAFFAEWNESPDGWMMMSFDVAWAT